VKEPEPCVFWNKVLGTIFKPKEKKEEEEEEEEDAEDN
jgi:hypothetical protein